MSQNLYWKFLIPFKCKAKEFFQYPKLLQAPALYAKTDKMAQLCKNHNSTLSTLVFAGHNEVGFNAWGFKFVGNLYSQLKGSARQANWKMATVALLGSWNSFLARNFDCPKMVSYTTAAKFKTEQPLASFLTFVIERWVLTLQKSYQFCAFYFPHLDQSADFVEFPWNFPDLAGLK